MFDETQTTHAPVSEPVGRMKLSRGATFMLMALRIYVLIAVPLVIYAFVHALNAAH